MRKHNHNKLPIGNGPIVRLNMPHKTAITRTRLSAPARYLLENNKLKGLTNLQGLRRTPLVLDYGCGKGGDAQRLGIAGYDPHYFPWPATPFKQYQGIKGIRRRRTIICTYVLNAIVSPQERAKVLGEIYSLLKPGGRAYITVRNDKRNLKGYTKRGTWQGYVKLPLPIEHKTSGYVMYRMEKNLCKKCLGYCLNAVPGTLPDSLKWRTIDHVQPNPETLAKQCRNLVHPAPRGLSVTTEGPSGFTVKR